MRFYKICASTNIICVSRESKTLAAVCYSIYRIFTESPCPLLLFVEKYIMPVECFGLSGRLQNHKQQTQRVPVTMVQLGICLLEVSLILEHSLSMRRFYSLFHLQFAFSVLVPLLAVM